MNDFAWIIDHSMNTLVISLPEFTISCEGAQGTIDKFRMLSFRNGKISEGKKSNFVPIRVSSLFLFSCWLSRRFASIKLENTFIFFLAREILNWLKDVNSKWDRMKKKVEKTTAKCRKNIHEINKLFLLSFGFSFIFIDARDNNNDKIIKRNDKRREKIN